MKCKSCGKENCMAHGGLADDESKGMKAEPKEHMGEQTEVGEPSDDDIVSDHMAHECMEAMHKKDKAGFKDTLHYLVSDIIGKMKS